MLQLRLIAGHWGHVMWGKQDAAAASIFLASKVEEHRLKLDYVLKATHAVRFRKEYSKVRLQPEVGCISPMPLVLVEQAILFAVS